MRPVNPNSFRGPPGEAHTVQNNIHAYKTAIASLWSAHPRPGEAQSPRNLSSPRPSRIQRPDAPKQRLLSRKNLSSAQTHSRARPPHICGSLSIHSRHTRFRRARNAAAAPYLSRLRARAVLSTQAPPRALNRRARSSHVEAPRGGFRDVVRRGAPEGSSTWGGCASVLRHTELIQRCSVALEQQGRTPSHFLGTTMDGSHKDAARSKFRMSQRLSSAHRRGNDGECGMSASPAFLSSHLLPCVNRPRGRGRPQQPAAVQEQQPELDGGNSWRYQDDVRKRSLPCLGCKRQSAKKVSHLNIARVLGCRSPTTPTTQNHARSRQGLTFRSCCRTQVRHWLAAAAPVSCCARRDGRLHSNCVAAHTSAAQSTFVGRRSFRGAFEVRLGPLCQIYFALVFSRFTTIKA